jgi:DNA modification methylase
MNKEDILKELRTITKESVVKEWLKLKNITLEELDNLNGRSRLGCIIIDYYFFQNRLETIGNKGINFYDFLDKIEFYKTKKYIKTLLDFCENNNRYNDSIIKRYYYCYGLCFGRINAFKITNSMQIYYKYKPKRILDPFCGFGGRLIAAMLLNIDYIGVDINVDLKEGYDKLLNDFKEYSIDKYNILFQDANEIDYSKYKYDMVFTSPPYDNIEIYKNSEKKTIMEWDIFYNSIFKKLWDNLEKGGIYAININKKIYEKTLVKIFGEAKESILLKKSSKNDYVEYIYVWKKD